MTYRKKLIEVALPLEAINVASAREKSLRHGHPSSIHVWWARRPLAACRAVIFSSLVDDPDDPEAPPKFVAACRKLPRGKNAAENDTPRQRLFDFIETLVQWESTTDEQVMDTARGLIRLATGGNPPPLLDPFAGGGSIPLEAQRLGLEAHASDLNPVAVMICKALVEIPPKFANRPPVNPKDREKMGGGTGWKGVAGLAADVHYYGEWMRDEAEKQVGHLFRKVVITQSLLSERPDLREQGLQPGDQLTVIAWLWARTVASPNPAAEGKHVPLVRSFVLSRKKGNEAWVQPVVDKSSLSYEFQVRAGRGEAPAGTIGHRGGECILTGTPIPLEHLQREGQAGRIRSRLLAVVVEGKRGRIFLSPDAANATILSQLPEPSWIPETELSRHPQYMAPPRYGMSRHGDLFTPRQLVALNAFCDLLPDVLERVMRDARASGLASDGISLHEGGTQAEAYAEAVVVYLGLSISKASDLASSLCRWQSNAEHLKLAPTFSRHALSMTWDYAEGNPFSGSSGNFLRQVELIAESLSTFPATPAGTAIQHDALSAASHLGSELLISTDPPYYDNVPYADLSDFFYVWLRRALQGVYPDLFTTVLVPKSQELVADQVRHGDRQTARQFFEAGLTQAFADFRANGSVGYPFTVYYAFREAENGGSHDAEDLASPGWEAMLEALASAGFAVDGTWPMRTERPGRLRETGSNALASSIILVCRPRPEDAPMTSRREFVNALRRELPAALREMLTGNIAPVDLAQASIGPGMAVYSRYAKVLEPNGDRLTVRTALQLINHELDAYLAEQEGYIDQDSRFAVAWFEQFGFHEGPFGQADVLARAKNTSVDGLAYAGVLKSGAGKVQLYHWSELDPGWDPVADRRPTVWEAVHHLVERLNVYGEEGAAMLLAKMPSDLAAQARQLAYRLYSICERKGWAEPARDYNALVISWGASQERARGFREQYQQGRLL